MEDGSGAVARRGVIGRGNVVSVGRAGSGLIVAWSRSVLGGFMMIGGSVTRGAIFCISSTLTSRRRVVGL